MTPSCFAIVEIVGRKAWLIWRDTHGNVLQNHTPMEGMEAAPAFAKLLKGRAPGTTHVVVIGREFYASNNLLDLGPARGTITPNSLPDAMETPVVTIFATSHHPTWETLQVTAPRRAHPFWTTCQGVVLPSWMPVRRHRFRLRAAR